MKERDVIVLLPGIMGSALEKDGRSIWDFTAGAISSALFSLGGSIDELALSSEISTGDGVTATRLLPDAHLLPFFWKIDGYAELSLFIQRRLRVTPGEDFFEFPYDWRLDNRISAQRLRSAALGWLENQRRRYSGARLVLIGHSMGGLVARYFLEALDGWRHTRMLITLGTPYRGSVKALSFLTMGLRKFLGPLKLVDLTRLVQSLPSVHQLLPIYPCLGETPEKLERLETIDRKTIGDLNIERARAGVAFHREIEKAVEANRTQPGYGYRILPVVGAYQPTFQSALLMENGIKPLLDYQGQSLLDGDGTVPRFSATPIELSNANADIFVACPHSSLQNFDPARVQVRAALEDIDFSQLKAGAAEPISLDIADAFAGGEQARFRVRCGAAVDPIRASVSDVGTGVTVECEAHSAPDADGWQEFTAGGLATGTYRVRAEADGVAQPVSDLFVVMES